MQKTLRELKIGSYENIETATESTSIITALRKFVERRVSALPLVDSEGRLVDIYAKFDVIVSFFWIPYCVLSLKCARVVDIHPSISVTLVANTVCRACENCVKH